jgi:hypothetical protein
MSERSNTLAFAAATGGFAATVLTGIACVGPLVAILLGVGGFGWLTQYAWLRVPASLATATLLAGGFYWVYFRPGRDRCARSATAKGARVVLWTATLLAIALNLFEYVIFPRLG